MTICKLSVLLNLVYDVSNYDTTTKQATPQVHHCGVAWFCWAVCLLAEGIFAVGQILDVEALIHNGIATIGEV